MPPVEARSITTCTAAGVVKVGVEIPWTTWTGNVFHGLVFRARSCLLKGSKFSHFNFVLNIFCSSSCDQVYLQKLAFVNVIRQWKNSIILNDGTEDLEDVVR